MRRTRSQGFSPRNEGETFNSHWQVKERSCEKGDMKRLLWSGYLLSSALCLFSPAAARAFPTIPWEHMTGYMSSPPYGWIYSYDIGLYSDVLMIDVDVRLVGYNPDPSLRSRWENGIESTWSTNRFSVPISFNVDWVTTDPDYSVTVVNGTGPCFRNSHHGRLRRLRLPMYCDPAAGQISIAHFALDDAVAQRHTRDRTIHAPGNGAMFLALKRVQWMIEVRSIFP